MFIERLPNRSAVCRSLESQQELLIRKIRTLAATLTGEKKWAGEIGDQLVYLKFHAANSFRAEKEAMLCHGFPAYDAHREQHEAIARELRRLLEQIADGGTTLPSITDATNRLLQRLQMHIAQHDHDLLVFMGKDRPHPEPVRHRELGSKELAAFFTDLHCYTA
jgi:hemerythrin